jgi:type I restriction enzyme S subunit
MRSSYKRLGDYICEVNIRNKNLSDYPLLGVSIKKVLMPSIANIIGTDMSTYKLIKKKQFAYGPVTSRNGDKISISLSEKYDAALLSQAYTVFKVIDENELHPEYLMMWFKRQEFDRYARFMSHGSAREIFSWAEMCDTLLPIPSPEKQLEILREYNVIQNRIKLHNKFIIKLEETAQTIYKQWFLDFEFPDANGKPYKSSGGEMVESELGEIPKGWRPTDLGKLLDKKGYIRGPFGSSLKKDDMQLFGFPVYEQQHAIYNHRLFRYFITEEKYNKLIRFSVTVDDLVISCSGTLGKITLIKKGDPIGIINQALLILRVDPTEINPVCLKYFLSSKNGNRLLLENASGSAQINIAKREVIQRIPFLLPEKNAAKKVGKILESINCSTILAEKQLLNLKLLKELMLAKLTKVEFEKEFA